MGRVKESNTTDARSPDKEGGGDLLVDLDTEAEKWIKENECLRRYTTYMYIYKEGVKLIALSRAVVKGLNEYSSYAVSIAKFGWWGRTAIAIAKERGRRKAKGIHVRYKTPLKCR